MTKQITAATQERIRNRLVQLIEESPARDLFEGRDSVTNSYSIKDGDSRYVLYQKEGGRWSFYERDILIMDRKDEEVVDRKFTDKIFRFLNENDISTTTLGGI